MIRVLAWAVANLVLLPLYATLGLLATVAALLPLFPTRTGFANLHAQLGMGLITRFLAMVRVYFSYGLYAVETFVLWPLGLVHVVNQGEFESFLMAVDAARAPGTKTGYLVLGAHFSNIEIGGDALTKGLRRALGGRCHMLAKPGASPVITRFLHWLRNRAGISILWTDRRDLARALLTCMKQGDSLGFLVDQKPEHGGVFVRFFADYAAFPVAGVDLAVRAGLQPLHLTAKRIAPGRFELVYAVGHAPSESGVPAPRGAFPVGNSTVVVRDVHPAMEPTSKEGRVAPLLAAYAGWLEGVVRQAPAQWCWDYRKWSRKPPSGNAEDRGV